MATSVRRRTWHMVLYILGLIVCLGASVLSMLLGICAGVLRSSPADQEFSRNLMIAGVVGLVAAIVLLVRIVSLTREGP